MRKILNILTILLICNYSYSQKIYTEKKRTFKEVLEASYSTQRSGELSREDAFNQKLSRKEIYNEKGIIIEYWEYEIDGTIYEKTELLKNNNGKLKKSSTYDRKGNLKRYITTELDKNDNIIFFRTFNAQHEPTSVQENRYDSNNNIISISRTNLSSNKTFRTIKKYNSQNQLVEETDLNPDGSIKDVRTFKYDENNNEVESDLTRPHGDYTKFISIYDEQNNILTQHWYDKDGQHKSWNNWEYVYDENGNWITRKRFSNGELGFVWERKIEYN